MRSLITVYVDNKFGVLTRVSSLFMRKSFNIDSLTVGETDDPKYSQINISLESSEYDRDQVVNQLYKLYNVKKVELNILENQFEREMMLLKVKNSPETQNELMSAADSYKARVLEADEKEMCVELTGEPLMLKAFLEAMKPFGILKMRRTGVVSIE